MVLSFDVEVAKEVGTDEAVIFYNFCFWIKHNQANEKNFFDGKYWTYNSRKALLILFPHLTESKIKTCLSNLEKKGFIVKGNYNKSAYDRTTWFSIGENQIAKRVYENNQSIGENYPMEKTGLSNGMSETIQPIPDINTNNYKNKNTLNKDHSLNKKESQEKESMERVNSFSENNFDDTPNAYFHDLREQYNAYGREEPDSIGLVEYRTFYKKLPNHRQLLTHIQECGEKLPSWRKGYAPSLARYIKNQLFLTPVVELLEQENKNLEKRRNAAENDNAEDLQTVYENYRKKWQAIEEQAKNAHR